MMASIRLAGACVLSFLVVFFLATIAMCLGFERGRAVAWVALLTCFATIYGQMVLDSFTREGLRVREVLARMVTMGWILSMSSSILGGVLGVLLGAGVSRALKARLRPKPADGTR